MEGWPFVVVVVVVLLLLLESSSAFCRCVEALCPMAD
jgi:hypothetical protein